MPSGLQPVIEAKIRRVSLLSGRFVLRSGATSDTYCDKYQFESDPVLLLRIAEAMTALVPNRTDALAGLEMGGIPLVTMLSHVTGLPAAFIRKAPKPYGTCRSAEGVPLAGKRFVLVEDVVSSGGAVIDAINRLRADGLTPDAVLCVIDRQMGGAEAIAGAGVPLFALFGLDEIERAT